MVFIPKPVLHLKMEGNADDSSGYDNDGIVTDATLTDDRWGNPNSAYSFNGTDQNITISNNVSLNPSNITISVWFKTLDTSGALISKTTSSGNKQWFILIHDSYNGHISSTVWNTSDTFAQVYGVSGRNVNDNIWHNAILTYDGTIHILYIDGKEANSSTVISGDLKVSIEDVIIGEYSSETFDLNGSIGDTRIYSVALTTIQVAYLYDKTKRNY